MQLIGFWSAPRPPAGRGNCAITNPRRHGLSIRLGSGLNDVALILGEPHRHHGLAALPRLQRRSSRRRHTTMIIDYAIHMHLLD